MRHFSLLILLVACTTAFAATPSSTPPVDTSYWKRTAGLGLNLDQGVIINPRVGSGLNRLGAGGLLTWTGNYAQNRAAWDNTFGLTLAAQRLGSGIIAQGATGAGEQIPFTKNNDEIRFNTKYGYALKPGGKLYVAANVLFLTQLLPTYTGNFLTSLGEDNPLISKFLSPAFLTAGIGLDWKPTENFSLFYSPAAYKGNFALDKKIAETRTFTPNGHQAFNQIGSMLSAKYTQKYLADDRLMVSHQLNLFSNYLENPENIDVDFQNMFQFQVFKGLSLQMLVNLAYDHDIQVQISNRDAVNGIEANTDGTPKLGRKTSITEAFLIKYGISF
jgi:Protein of unknown function (DUF3078)